MTRIPRTVKKAAPKKKKTTSRRTWKLFEHSHKGVQWITSEKIAEIVDMYTSGMSKTQIANHFGVGLTTIHRAVPTKEKIFRKDGLNHGVFSTVTSERVAYLVGFIATDGNVYAKTNTVTISTAGKDFEHLQELSKIFGTTKAVEHRVDGSCQFRVSSPQICKDLLRLGIFPNKSLTLQKVELPPRHFRHFIRGVFDGDGCIHYNTKTRKTCVFICGASKPFIDYIAGQLAIEGFCTSITQEGPSKHRIHTLYRLSILKHSWYTFYEYMYKDATIKLNRKYNKYTDATRNN